MSAPITTVTVVQAAMGQVYRSVEVRSSDAMMGWRQLLGHRGGWDFTRTGQRRTPRHRDGELPRHPSGEG
jgi:predicted secreted protein